MVSRDTSNYTGGNEHTETGSVRQPRQDRSMATKERIIDAGFRLFSRKGYHNTNSKEIVREAGTGIGSFYDYFSDKKDLFLVILRRHRDEFLRSMNAPGLNKKPAGAQIRGIVGEFIEFVSSFHENAPAFHQEAVLLRHSDPDIRGIMDEWDEANRQVIIGLFAAMASQVRLKDPDAASFIIVRTIEDIIHFIHLSNTSVDKNRLKNELIDCIYRYIFGK